MAKDHGVEEAGMPFFILTEETELQLNFEPSQLNGEESSEHDEVFMEDFIKEIIEA